MPNGTCLLVRPAPEGRNEGREGGSKGREEGRKEGQREFRPLQRTTTTEQQTQPSGATRCSTTTWRSNGGGNPSGHATAPLGADEDAAPGHKRDGPGGEMPHHRNLWQNRDTEARGPQKKSQTSTRRTNRNSQNFSTDSTSTTSQSGPAAGNQRWRRTNREWYEGRGPTPRRTSLAGHSKGQASTRRNPANSPGTSQAKLRTREMPTNPKSKVEAYDHAVRVGTPASTPRAYHSCDYSR